MKVVHLLPALEQGGVETVVCDLNRVLVGAGCESVVCSCGGRLADRIVRDGGRHIALNLKSKNPLTYFSRALKLRRVLRDEKPDLVCVHSRVPAWLFVWANRALGLRWISYAHGANSVSCYSEVMTKGDLVVVPSKFLADFLKANYGIADEKIRVIPNAVDRERFDLERLDRDFIAAKRAEWKTDGFFIVMALGRITQLKGFDVLVREMCKLPERFKLVIVGEAEARRKSVETELKRLVDERRMEGRVIFAGNQEKVAECLSIADVVVSSNTKKPESFGRSMAEALVMGKPVVAKAFGGALGVVRDGVDGILTKDAEFAEAIEKVSQMTFVNLRKDALERFSFGKMCERTLATYGEFDIILPRPSQRIKYDGCC